MARILLADDDPTALDIVSRALTAEGHHVVRCSDGQEALQQLLSAPKAFDLLLSDVEMPGLDGVELAKRANAAAPGLRILLMSGFSGGTGRIEQLAIPRIGFVSKPLSLEQVRASVRAALA